MNPVGDLSVAPSLRERVLGDSWCHAEVYAAARSKPAFRRGGPTAASNCGMPATWPAQNMSAPTAAIDRWFQFHTNNESYAPKAWTVAKPDDVPRPWHEIGASSKSKTVYRATVKGKSVIVKGRKMRKDGWTGDARHDQGGCLLYTSPSPRD